MRHSRCGILGDQLATKNKHVMKHEVSVEIDHPIDEVFRLANDHMPEWSVTVVEDEILNETPDGVGSTFRMVTEEKGRRMEFDGVVTTYDPPRVSAVQMTNAMLDIETQFTFEEVSGKTRVTQNATVKGKGIYKLMMFVFGLFAHKSSCKASENELNCLKRYCESQG